MDYDEEPRTPPIPFKANLANEQLVPDISVVSKQVSMMAENVAVEVLSYSRLIACETMQTKMKTQTTASSNVCVFKDFPAASLDLSIHEPRIQREKSDNILRGKRSYGTREVDVNKPSFAKEKELMAAVERRLDTCNTCACSSSKPRLVGELVKEVKMQNLQLKMIMDQINTVINEQSNIKQMLRVENMRRNNREVVEQSAKKISLGVMANVELSVLRENVGRQFGGQNRYDFSKKQQSSQSRTYDSLLDQSMNLPEISVQAHSVSPQNSLHSVFDNLDWKGNEENVEDSSNLNVYEKLLNKVHGFLQNDDSQKQKSEDKPKPRSKSDIAEATLKYLENIGIKVPNIALDELTGKK